MGLDKVTPGNDVDAGGRPARVAARHGRQFPL